MDYETLKEKILDLLLPEVGNDYPISEEWCQFMAQEIAGIIQTQEKNMPVIDEENIDDFFPSSGETKYGFLR